jgi:predicted Zn-dependent protease
MMTRPRSVALMLVLALVIPFSVAAKTNERVTKKKPKNKKQDVEAIGDRNVGKGMNFYSLEKEIAMGKRMAQQIERHAKIVDDPTIAEYVNRVGQNLVRNSDAKVPFTIKLIDSQVVNAFALPGGFFFVNAGLMLRAESESELASVMAHEIAHVAARHGTRQATRGQVVSLATIPLIFMGGWTGFGIRQAAGFAIPMGFLKFNRGFEEEADFLGLQYLYKAGYDPTSFIDFFEKMKADEKRKPGTMAKLFSGHPPHGSRIRKTQKHIDELLPNKPEYVVSTSEFLEVKERLFALTRRSKEAREDPNRPRLRRTTSGGTIPTEDSEGDAGGEGDEEDDRPTLKRR